MRHAALLAAVTAMACSSRPAPTPCAEALDTYRACYGEPDVPGMPRHQALLEALDSDACDGLTRCYADCLLTVPACWECQFTDSECDGANPLQDCVTACEGW